MEAQRQITANRLRGTTPAASRPAFGFALDVSTRADVRRDIDRAGGACKEELEGAALRCEVAAAAGRPSVRDAFFRFSPDGVLVAVDVVREPASPEAAASLVEQLTSKLSREAGPVTTSRGEATASALGSGHLAQAVREYRFTDYAADVTATNFGEGGKSPDVVVREQYRSLHLATTASR